MARIGQMPKFTNYFIIFNIFYSVYGLRCGEVQVGVGFIHGGEYSVKGQWPWYASLHFVKNGNYFCGSTIISEKHLLSAAHCFYDKSHSKATSHEDVFAQLGRYNFKEERENYIKAFFEKISIHHNWRPSSPKYDADIAVIQLKDKIRFTNYIQPICLPHGIKNIEGLKGTVVGYGFDNDDHKTTDRPKHVELEVKGVRCLYDLPLLARIGSENMFCAGEKGKNPCQGDSGGGFYYKFNGIWTILGIVSSGASVACSENVYILYTNVVKFLNFIDETLQEEQESAGEECKNFDNTMGVCRIATKCPWAIKLISSGEKKHHEFTRCGFRGNVIEICCKDLMKVQRKAEVACEQIKKLKVSSNEEYRIFGGEPAEAGEFPHLVALGYASRLAGDVTFACGGSLISKDFVLTAAHCTNRDLTIIKLGKTSLGNGENEKYDGFQAVEIEIQKTFKHENYSRINKRNNIGLVQLASPITKYTSTIKPACLSTSLPSIKFTISGWGKVRENLREGSNWLQKAEVSFSKCGDYKPDENQFCTIGSRGEHICSGDSGSPLQYKENIHHTNNFYYIIAGVVAGGTSCNDATSANENYDLIIRVDKYLDWIEKHVWPGSVDI